VSDFYLVKLSAHGNVIELSDGPHSDCKGVEQALYLHQNIGLTDEGTRYGCAEVIITDVEPKGHGANEEALGRCRMMMDRYKPRKPVKGGKTQKRKNQ